MIDDTKRLIGNQLDAALCTLDKCIHRCPDKSWDAPVVNYAFCQVVFHVLFYADVYLGTDMDSIRTQTFHRDHSEFFRDYEELVDRRPVLVYDRPTIKQYMAHCRTKAAEAIAAETEQSLSAPCGFPRRDFSRAELYIYVTRHIQHHAAQLSLRLRINHDIDVPWVGSGWSDV